MKNLFNIIRRLIFVPVTVLFIFCSILITFIYFLIIVPLYWIFTGDTLPDYYLEDYKEQWFNYVSKILPNNDSN